MKDNTTFDGKYIKLQCIGVGSFGVVYKSKRNHLSLSHKSENEIIDTISEYALKLFFSHLHPVLPLIEVLILNYIQENIDQGLPTMFPKIIDGVTELSLLSGTSMINNPEEGIYYVVPYFENSVFNDHYDKVDLEEIKCYIRKLLLALNSLHELGLVHRDIKPDNFLYNFIKKEGILIDFGITDISANRSMSLDQKDTQLSEINSLFNKYSLKNRYGTRGFLAPETMLNYRYQTHKVDIWAVGIILLIFFAKRLSPLVLNKRLSKINVQSIFDFYPILALFDRDEVLKLFKACSSFCNYPEQIKQASLVDLIERKDIDEDGIDLLKCLLKLDFNERLDAKSALAHKWLKT